MEITELITWLRSEAEFFRNNAKRAMTVSYHDACLEKANMLTAAADWIEEHDDRTN